ncbi:oxidoreductase [Natrinema saccharevitans]|uniref:Oxidoreductase n=1 Tax=Natrinema saccharevitans TaxID=301967 RepID=A0A1S8ARP8_9EURY|nr:NAD(P)/FAD-dependent oxidoreductase [Natrinema saccharevitans]OLZ39350.1 oxidoreductase [Natrinema saccharevitans]
MISSGHPRYDADRVSRVGGHAVVVGASMAGLLAGRVLADAFRTVTIIDRDPLPDEAVARPSVPQADHVHVMLEPGRVILEDLFPGYGEELLSSGGLGIDNATDLEYYQRGEFLAEGPNRLPMYCASRPLFERIVRRRLAERDDVTLRAECQFTAYDFDGSASRIEGVRIANSDGCNETLAADVVVDATGRTSRTPAWLERHHYAPPVEEEVTVDLAYSTLVLERPSADRHGVMIVPSPPDTRGGTAIPVEDDRWIVTLFGLHGDHPPTDAAGIERFARRLPTPEIHRLLETHEWVSDDVRQYPFPSSRRRRYEDLHRFPDGLLVIGDAIASFNPIYGQGMSVAALEAIQLHHALADGGLADLASRFFDRVGDVVDTVWRMAVGADFEFADTTGPKPLGTDLLNRYLARVIETAQTDAHVSDRFARVLRLEEPPPTLFAPSVLWRVLAPTEVGRRVR